ncbi:MAG: hypothetical protein ABIK89_20380 [Planctomycetota bacterium]
MDDLTVRPETPDDHRAVYQVNAAAFGRETEADPENEQDIAGTVEFPSVFNDAW